MTHPKEKFFLVAFANYFFKFVFPQEIVFMLYKVFWNRGKYLGVLNVGINSCRLRFIAEWTGTSCLSCSSLGACKRCGSSSCIRAALTTYRLSCDGALIIRLLSQKAFS